MKPRSWRSICRERLDRQDSSGSCLNSRCASLPDCAHCHTAEGSHCKRSVARCLLSVEFLLLCSQQPCATRRSAASTLLFVDSLCCGKAMDGSGGWQERDDGADAVLPVLAFGAAGNAIALALGAHLRVYDSKCAARVSVTISAALPAKATREDRVSVKRRDARCCSCTALKRVRNASSRQRAFCAAQLNSETPCAGRAPLPI